MENKETFAERIKRLLNQNYFKKLSFLVPSFIKNRIPEIPPEVKERFELVLGIFQPIFIIVTACLFVAIMLSVLTKAPIFNPDNAQEVLALVDDPNSLTYSIEAVREKRIDGSILRQDSLRGIQINKQGDEFQAQLSGISKEGFRIVGDKENILYQPINNPQALFRLNMKYPNKIKPVLPSEVYKAASGGKIINDQVTVLGEKGWLVTWNPSKDIIQRLLLADLITKMPNSILGYDSEDLETIAQENYVLDYATATVNQSKLLSQLEIGLTLKPKEKNPAKLTILVSYRKFDDKQFDNINNPQDIE